MKKQIEKLIKFILILFLVALAPLAAFAQTTSAACAGVGGINGVLCRVKEIFDNILPLLVGLGVIYFVWGVVQYVIGGGEEAKKKGRDRIIYGIIGLAVVVSIWGLVTIVTGTLGIGGERAPNISNLTPTQTTNSGASCELGNNPKLQNLLGYVTCIINNSVIPLLFALAVVMFIWGAINFFIIGAGEEAKKAQGRQFMLWGIIALAVMLSVWGLVGILRATFNLNTGGSILPQVRPPN